MLTLTQAIENIGQFVLQTGFTRQQLKIENGTVMTTNGTIAAMAPFKADFPDKPIVVLGDFNSATGDATYNAILRDANGKDRLYDVPQHLAKADRYSYSYRGQKDLLDHMFVTGELQGFFFHPFEGFVKFVKHFGRAV